MAWLEKRGERYRIKFRYGGQHFQHGLRTESEREAKALLGRLEDNLLLLERGKLDVPASADLPLFLLSDGKLSAKPVIEKRLTVGELFRRYQDAGGDSKESSTRYTEKIHLAHLERLLGSDQSAQAITTERLQAYVDARGKETGSRGPVTSVTVQKEIGTFSAIWNRWAVPRGLVSGPAPTKGLVYRKEATKAPFQTFEQIERKIARGGLKPEDGQMLWESLFLSTAQIEEVLAYAKDHSRADWVYPMFAFAARTGARRSEMLRSQIDDFDFEGQVVRIREKKKKDQSKDLTFRHVPLSPLLASVMRNWFAKHPGGQLTLCQEPDVSVTPAMAAHQFVRALEGGKWKVLRGWHTFRHSFCSNCAARGIDQRIINAWMGHVTEEMARRYQHLFPSHEQKAMAELFA